MKRRKWLLTLAITGLAGCQSEQQEEEEPFSYEDCGPWLRMSEIYMNESEILNTDENITQYQELSEEKKEEFQRALEKSISDFKYGEWDPASFIRYQDEYYRVSISVC